MGVIWRQMGSLLFEVGKIVQSPDQEQLVALVLVLDMSLCLLQLL